MRKPHVVLVLSLLWLLITPVAPASRYLPHTRRQNVSVRFLARSTSSRLGMSGGNQDVYLVLLTTRKGRVPVLAKLVDEYLYYQDEVPEDVLRFGKPLHVVVQRWTLCDSAPSGFRPSVVYGPPGEALMPVDVSSSSELPCYKLDHHAVDQLND